MTQKNAEPEFIFQLINDVEMRMAVLIPQTSACQTSRMSLKNRLIRLPVLVGAMVRQIKKGGVG